MSPEQVIIDLLSTAEPGRLPRGLRPPRLDALLVRQDRAPPEALRRALDDPDSLQVVAPFLGLETVLDEIVRHTEAPLAYPWAPLAALLCRLCRLGHPDLALSAISDQGAEARFEILRDLVDALPPEAAGAGLQELVRYARDQGSTHALLAVLPRLGPAQRRALVAETVGLDARGHEGAVVAWLGQQVQHGLRDVLGQDPYARAISLEHIAHRRTPDTPTEAVEALVAAQLTLAELPPSSQPYPRWRIGAFDHPVPEALRPRAAQILDALEPGVAALARLRYAAHTDAAQLPRALSQLARLSAPHRALGGLVVLRQTGRLDPSLCALLDGYPTLVAHPDWRSACELWPIRSPVWRATLWAELAWHAPGAQQVQHTDRALQAHEADLRDHTARQRLPVWSGLAACDPGRWLQPALDHLDALPTSWEQRGRQLIALCDALPGEAHLRTVLAEHLQRTSEGGRVPSGDESWLLAQLEDEPPLRDAFAGQLLEAATRCTDPRARANLLWCVATHARGEPQREGFTRLWELPEAWDPPGPWLARIAAQRPELVDPDQLRRLWDHTAALPLWFDPLTHLSGLCPLFPPEQAAARRAEVIAGHQAHMKEVFQDTRSPFEALAPQLQRDEIDRALAAVEASGAEAWERDDARHTLLLRLIALDPHAGQIATEAAKITHPSVGFLVDARRHSVLREQLLAQLPRLLGETPHRSIEACVRALLERFPGDPRIADTLSGAIAAQAAADRIGAPWDALAIAALATDQADAVWAAHASDPPDARAKLGLALARACTPDDPRAAGWITEILALEAQLSDEVLEDWQPEAHQLIGQPPDLVAPWLRRALSLQEPPQLGAVCRALSRWLPALQGLGGPALLEAIAAALAPGAP